MKKNLKEYVIVFIFIILLLGVFISIKNKVILLFKEFEKVEEKEEIIIEHNKNYSINYLDEGYVYNINSYANEKYIYVKKTKIVICQAIECSYNIVDEYNIYLEGNKLNYVKGFIKSLSIKYGYNNIYKDNLDDKEKNIIYSLTNNTENFIPNDENIYYDISFVTNDGNISEKGYKITKNDDYYTIAISMGQSLINSHISIEEIKKINNNIYIYVKENFSEKMGDKVATGVTYPMVEINIYDEFNSIVVKNNDSEIYKELR